MYNRATPEIFLQYKHALCVYKLFNSSTPHSLEWVALNLNSINTSRQTTFKVMRQNKKKVGLNALANRSFIVNDKIPLDWLNNSFETFKVKCKLKFLV